MADNSRTDDTTGRIPSGLDNTRVLPGFLGKSETQGFIRLHRVKDLSEYLDIRQEDILHREATDSTIGGLRRTLLWVKREANIRHCNTVSQHTDNDARVLIGRIVKGHFRGSGQTGFPGGGLDDFVNAAGSSGTQSATTLDCWHCCSVSLSGC